MNINPNDFVDAWREETNRRAKEEAERIEAQHFQKEMEAAMARAEREKNKYKQDALEAKVDQQIESELVMLPLSVWRYFCSDSNRSRHILQNQFEGSMLLFMEEETNRELLYPTAFNKDHEGKYLNASIQLLFIGFLLNLYEQENSI